MKDTPTSINEKGLQIAVRIGKTAAVLFNKKGYLETSMNDIAAKAKMSKGGIYHYFSSKDEILYFILSNYMDLILKDLEQELSKIETKVSKIKFIISRHIDLYTKNLPEAKTLLKEANCLPKNKFKVIAEKQRKYFQIVSSLVWESIEKPVQNEKITALTFLLFGMCNWIYSWYHPKGSITPNELSDLIYDIFMKGMGGFQ
jgi:AcrR family transcriptional regulator